VPARCATGWIATTNSSAAPASAICCARLPCHDPSAKSTSAAPADAFSERRGQQHQRGDRCDARELRHRRLESIAEVMGRVRHRCESARSEIGERSAGEREEEQHPAGRTEPEPAVETARERADRIHGGRGRASERTGCEARARERSVCSREIGGEHDGRFGALLGGTEVRATEQQRARERIDARDARLVGRRSRALHALVESARFVAPGALDSFDHGTRQTRERRGRNGGERQVAGRCEIERGRGRRRLQSGRRVLRPSDCERTQSQDQREPQRGESASQSQPGHTLPLFGSTPSSGRPFHARVSADLHVELIGKPHGRD
jgi:hypothetical protein